MDNGRLDLTRYCIRVIQATAHQHATSQEHASGIGVSMVWMVCGGVLCRSFDSDFAGRSVRAEYESTSSMNLKLDYTYKTGKGRLA